MPVRLLQVTALAAFFCASGARAGDGFDSFMGKVVGNSTTVSYGSGGTPMVTSSANLGTPHTYGGVGIDMASPAVKGNVSVPLGNTGKVAQVTAKAAISRANVAKGLINLAKLGRVTPGGLLAGIAIDAMIDYGLKNIKLGDDGSIQADAESQLNYPVFDGWEYGDDSYGWSLDLVSGCRLGLQNNYGSSFVIGSVTAKNASACDFQYKRPSDSNWSDFYINVSRKSSKKCTVGWYVANGICTQAKPVTQMSEQEIQDWIASRDGWPTSSAVAMAEMLKYPDIRPILRPFPDNGVTVSGPSSVSGASTKTTDSVKLLPGTNVEAPPGTTQTDPGTKTTTTTKTHPISYSGPDVKYGTLTNNVTNITNNVTNVTTTEATKTEEKQDDNEPDLCEKHPNTIGCKEIDFDTPEGEIPRKQIDVSWSPVDLGLGGGSCPAPVPIGPDKQFSYQATCDNLHIIKPLVIAIALFVGGMILFGGRADQ